MTVNQKKSLIAFFLSKYNMKAFEELGYTGSMTLAMADMSQKITGAEIKPNSYIKRRRDEFDVFFDNGRAGQRNRKPSKQVLNMYLQWNEMSFTEISSIAKMIIEGRFDRQDIIESSEIDGVSEGEIEVYFNDESAKLKESVRTVIERSYSRQKINMLKRLYSYRCQICGQNVGENYGVDIAEVHHIRYFSESVDNSSDNLLVLCPNHHRLIHKLNPKFDYEKLEYVYSNGNKNRLILNLHLPYE